jgi:ABC-type transport system involved in cytochrome bd biosynthesis fused ATPase/permease subunit
LFHSQPISMNKRRLIFFGIFGIYHLVAFIFTMMISDIGMALKIVPYISWFKYGTLLGLLLLVIDLIWWMMESKASLKTQEESRHENNTLKAKVYDLQETSKGAATNPKG